MDAETLSGFFFFAVVVTPTLSWILTPRRFTKMKGLLYSISFLAALTVCTIGLKYYEQSDNFYHMLKVTREATLPDLKRAFRAQSVMMHPDKNPSPNATEEFNRLRVAFEVLSDTDKRETYDFLGEEAALMEDTSKTTFVDLLTNLATFYLVWGVLSYLVTLGDNCGEARSWLYCGMALIFVLEMNIAFGKIPIKLRHFPQLTPYEIINLLRSVIPMYMNACRALGSFYHVDLDEDNFAASLELLRSNTFLIMKMEELRVQVEGLQHHGKSAMSKLVTDDIPELTARRTKRDKSPSPEPATDAEVAAEKQKVEEEANLANPTAVIQSPPKTSIPIFVWGILAYLIITYLFL